MSSSLSNTPFVWFHCKYPVIATIKTIIKKIAKRHDSTIHIPDVDLQYIDRQRMAM